MPLVLDLFPDSLKDANGSGEVVDPPGGLQSSLDDFGSRDQVVGEAVVEPSLELKKVFDGLEKANVAGGEVFEGLVAVWVRGVRAGCGSAEKVRGVVSVSAYPLGTTICSSLPKLVMRFASLASEYSIQQ